MKLQRRHLKRAGITLLLLAVFAGGMLGVRGYRLATFAYDLESQLRYLIDDGGTIGTSPAAETFSDLYLQVIFGDNPQLLEQVRTNIREGVERDPDLMLGEVAAMLVTHREDDNGSVLDVAVHVIGGFPLGRMAPQFHRDGFFRQHVDENLWSVANTALRFAGREMVLLADEEVADRQSAVLDGIFDGRVGPLLVQMEEPIFYTMVLPNPRRVMPPQLRHHISAVIYQGAISHHAGRNELVLLTNSRRSANYTMSVISDLKRVAELALKTRFDGVEYEAEWGTTTGPWWSYEMAQTSEQTTIEREDNLVRLTSDFERVMVNAIVKSIERFGRDWRRKRLVMEEGLDPREADRRMASRSPLHYWSDEHRWGPDWPVAPSDEERRLLDSQVELRNAERTRERAEAQLRRHEEAAQQANERREELEAAAAREAETEEGVSARTASRLQAARERANEAETQLASTREDVDSARQAQQNAEAEVERAERAFADAQERRLQRVSR